MTDDTTQAPSADDLSDEAKKSLNPKLKKLAEIRSRAEAVIERTEEEELELIEDALEADFGDKATTVTGELPDPASYDSGESTDAPSDEPVTLEPSEATTSDAAPGGDGDANAEDSGAPAAMWQLTRTRAARNPALSRTTWQERPRHRADPTPEPPIRHRAGNPRAPRLTHRS